MNWTIYCYHNVKALRGVFDAIAAVSGAGDYKASIMVVLFFGFFAAATAYAFAPQKMVGWQWISSVTLVFLVLFVPKARIQLVDVTADEPPAVVANVPFGLALLAGATTTVGHQLTELTETAFSSVVGTGPDQFPEQLSYQRNGMMFGARMVKMTQDVTFRSPALRADMLEFFANCVEPELNNGSISTVQFKNSTNIWSTLDGKMNPARFTTLSGRADELATCDAAYQDLTPRIKEESSNLLSLIAFEAHPTLNQSEAVSRVEDEVTAAYAAGRLADASLTAGDIVAQNAVVHAVNDGFDLSFARTGDATGYMMSYAQSATFHQKNSAFISNAKIAEQALPVVRNVVEAVTYALFPFVVLLLMLSSGRDTAVGLRNYASVLIWIQLWPPLYAVLNYMASIYAQYDMAAAAMIDPASRARGVALATFGAINDTAFSCQAVVGYLTASIPVLAWVALKRMENFGSTVAGAMSGLQQTGDAVASAASMGNLSWSGVSRGQQSLGVTRSNAEVSRTQDDRATWFTEDAHGHKTYQMPRNSGITSSTFVVDWSERKAAALQHSVDFADAKRKSARDTADAALRTAYSHKRGITDSKNGNESTGRDSKQGGSMALKSIDNLAGQFLDKMGVQNTADLRQALAAHVYGNGIFHSGGKAAGSGVEKLKNALESKNVENGKTWAEDFRETAQTTLGTLADQGTLRGEDAALVKALSSSSEASVAYSDAVSRKQSAEGSVGTKVITQVDLTTATDWLAWKQLNSRDVSPAELVHIAHQFPMDPATRRAVDFELAGMSAPSPTQEFTMRNGTRVGPSTDLNQVFKTSSPETVPLDRGELERVEHRHAHNEHVVKEAVKKGHGKDIDTVPQDFGGSKGAGSGHADGTYANMNRGTTVAQPMTHMPALGKEDTAFVESVKKGKKEIENKYVDEATRAANHIPGARVDANGNLTVAPKAADLAGEQVVRRLKAFDAFDTGLGSMLDDAQMAYKLARQKGDLTPHAVEAAKAELKDLKEKARLGDEDAVRRLKEVEPTLFHYSESALRPGVNFGDILTTFVVPKYVAETAEGIAHTNWSSVGTMAKDTLVSAAHTAPKYVAETAKNLGNGFLSAVGAPSGQGGAVPQPASPAPVMPEPRSALQGLGDSLRAANPHATEVQIGMKVEQEIQAQAFGQVWEQAWSMVLPKKDQLPSGARPADQSAKSKDGGEAPKP